MAEQQLHCWFRGTPPISLARQVGRAVGAKNMAEMVCCSGCAQVAVAKGHRWLRSRRDHSNRWAVVAM
eukprot:4003753-Pyramimonas_sp.AAC.1